MSQNSPAVFFISCAIGMESELENEIAEVWGELLDLDGRPHSQSLPELKTEKGGVELAASFHLALQLNFFLRLPHRLLYRVRQFRCRDFPKLFSEAKKLNLKDIVGDQGFILEVSARQSRLGHEGRIEDTLREAWKGQVLEKRQGESPLGQQKVFVRFYEDLCSISLDTSGEHLHFRGGEFKGEAPLRETLAHYCLRKMIGSRSLAALQEVQLVDPMVGSGTFLLEAAQFFALNRQRDFAFLHWKKTPRVLASSNWAQNYFLSERQPFHLIGRDLDPKVLEACQQNLKTHQVQAQLAVQDLFAPAEDSLPPAQERWVLTNPPYGERLAANFEPQQLLKGIGKKYSPLRLGVLFSQRQAKSLPRQVGEYRLEASDRLLNGGIECQFQIWQRGNGVIRSQENDPT